MPKRSKIHNKVAKPRKEQDKWYYYNNRKDPVRIFRRSTKWRKCQEMYANHHPYCCDPFNKHEKDGQSTYMKDVHHIIGLRQNINLGLVWGNLCALCRECHARIEQMEKAGTATQHLFRGRDRD